jgi:hypothetical protein
MGTSERTVHRHWQEIYDQLRVRERQKPPCAFSIAYPAPRTPLGPPSDLATPSAAAPPAATDRVKGSNQNGS